MMKKNSFQSKNDSLVDLIQSLTPSEKRYFQIFTQDQNIKGEKYYLELFRIIDKHNSSSEKILKEGKASPEIIKNISFYKNYLYNHILKALRVYYSNNSKYVELQERLTDIHILIDKKLFSQAEKRIKSAKKIARKYHFDIILLKLISLERGAIRAYDEKKSFDKIQSVQEEMHNHLTQLLNQNKVTDLYDKLYLISRNKFIREKHYAEVLSIIEREKYELENLELSFLGKMTYHLLLANYHQAVGDNAEDSLYHLEVLIEHYESDEAYLKEHMERYISLLNNYLNFYFFKNDFSPYLDIITKLKQLKPPSKSIEIKLFLITTNLQLVYFIRTFQYEKALDLAPEIEYRIKKDSKKIPRLNKRSLRLNVAFAYFHTQQYSETIKWIQPILNDKKQDIRQDISLFSRVLELLIHFEKEDFELVSYKIDSLNRLVRRIIDPSPSLVLVKLVTTSLSSMMGEFQVDEKEILSNLRKDLSSYETPAVGKEEIITWLDRRLLKFS